MYKKIFAIVLFISTSSFAQITDGLVLFYNMDENCIDITDNGNDGSQINTEIGTDEDGDLGDALYFNGEAYILLPDEIQLKPELPISISMRIKPDNFDEVQALYHSDFLDNNYAGFFVNITTTGQVMAHISGDNGTNSSNNRRSYLSNESLVAGEWQYVTIVINAYNDMKIYIDCRESEGEYSGTGSTEIIYSSSAGRIAMGGETSSYPDGYYFQGTMDELAFWDRALETSEIDKLCEGIMSDLNIDNRYLSNEFQVFTDLTYINIALSESLMRESTELELYHISGSLIGRFDVDSQFMSVQKNGLQSGTYLLIIKDKEFVLATKKFVIL